MHPRLMLYFTWRTSGCIRPNATGAIAPSPLLELRNQPIDSPRERGHLTLRKLASQAVAPLLVGRTELVDQRAPATGELHARGAEIFRIVVAFREAELLEARDHAGH